MIAQLKDPTESASAIADIATLLRERHGIIPPAEDDFRVTSPQAQVAQVAAMTTPSALMAEQLHDTHWAAEPVHSRQAAS